MPSTRSLPARVIVADDYPLFRDGLRRVVRRYLPQAAVSEAGSFDEVLRLASSVSPEPPALFVLDLLLPGFAASQSIERLRRAYRHSAIVIVSMLDDPRLVDEVLAANPGNVAEYKAGKEKAFNALVGQVMKAAKGKANPQQVNDLLKAKLAG